MARGAFHYRTPRAELAASSLNHRPAGPWAFDVEVARVFADMLQRSVPAYETMRKLVFDVGKAFVRPSTAIVDLGSSRGEAIAPFLKAFGSTTRCVGVEVSPGMLEASRTRFAREIEVGELEMLDLDIQHDYPDLAACLTLCVLTLQFTRVECRRRIVEDAFKNTVAGGAFLLVEKVRGSSHQTDQLLSQLHHDMKRANGYGDDEIHRKRLSLEGVLVPGTVAWNEDLLYRAGFCAVECFYRCLNFAGWVAIKADAPKHA